MSNIQIDDLKCGNILNYLTSEGDILPTIIDWQDLKWLTEDPKGFNLVHSPMPFTVDIILKLGFKLVYESDYGKIYETSQDVRFDIRVKKDNEKLYNIRFKGTNIHEEIRFVHQFQNFFYCIKGVMLTF